MRIININLGSLPGFEQCTVQDQYHHAWELRTPLKYYLNLKLIDKWTDFNFAEALTIELLKDRPARSFQIQIPICLDQFLQRCTRQTRINSLDKRTIKIFKFQWRLKTYLRLVTAASVVNFKPKHHFVVFLTGFLYMTPKWLQLWFETTPWFLPIKREFCSIIASV